jgi:hypothetical protein
MRESVVPDGVAGLQDFANDLRPQLDVFPDHEKSGVNAMPGKNVEHPEGVRVIGAIVVSERHLT